MMKKEIVVYTIEELSSYNEKGFMNAYCNWLETCEYWNGNDNKATLNAFLNEFNIKIENEWYNEVSYDYAFYIWDEETEDLKGEKLYNYLIENHIDVIRNEIELTGYFMDFEILYHLKKFVEAYEKSSSESYYKNMNFETLIKLCLDEFFNACTKDYSYCMSEEFFIEESNANEWYYTIDGKLI